MSIIKFRALSEAEARRQRRMQLGACMAARSVNFDPKDFERHIKALSDD